MEFRTDVAPDTLPVSLEPEGVEVTYADGRRVFYHGVPGKTEGGLVAGPGKDVHVLVTDPSGEEGVMVYVNDRDTHDDVLESSGVGRLLVERGETATVFPGVEATNHGYRVEVSADPETARGRVFVFVEDALSERSVEIVGESPDAGGSPDVEETTEAGRTTTDRRGGEPTTDGQGGETTNDGGGGAVEE